MSSATGFMRLECVTCQRQTWHYQMAGAKDGPRCCDHSDYPPMKTPLPIAAIVGTIAVQGSMRTAPHWHGVRDRRPVRAIRTRAVRRCGCVTEHPVRMFCARCFERLRVTECPAHAGYVVPLPGCGCQTTYTFGGAGGAVQVACGYCGCPTVLWGIKEAVAGRWGRIEKQVGVTAEGMPLMERRSLPFTQKLLVCEACAADYALVVRATRKAKGPGAAAFLPL